MNIKELYYQVTGTPYLDTSMYPNIFGELFNCPLYITDYGYDQFISRISNKAISGQTDIEKIIASLLPQPELDSTGVITIPFKGVVVSDASIEEQYFAGLVSCQRIQEQIEASLENPDVKSILFDVDSPGGTVRCNELAQYLLDSRGKKPMAAYTSGLIASAAYYVFASLPIYLTMASEVGSIDCICQLVDTSKMREMVGIEVIKFSQTQLKQDAAGSGPYSDKFKDVIQQRTVIFSNRFRDFVAIARPNINKETAFDGFTQLDEDAVDAKMADMIVRSKDEAKLALNYRINQNK